MGQGDELMATGDAARLYAETGKKVIILDRNDRARHHELFRGNPKIHTPSSWVGSLRDHALVRSGPGRRPYANYEAIEALGRRNDPTATERKKIRRAASRLFFNFDYSVHSGEVFLDESEQHFGETVAKKLGPFVIVEPNIKGRVPAKQWGVPMWTELAAKLSKEIKVVQIGDGRGIKLPGVHQVRTPTFRQAMAVMQHCQTFVVPEGGTHHAMGALNKRGVALFAGRTPLILSYPEQVTWFVEHKGGACGMEHVDCPYCRALWNALEIQDVMEMVRKCV